MLRSDCDGSDGHAKECSGVPIFLGTTLASEDTATGMASGPSLATSVGRLNVVERIAILYSQAGEVWGAMRRLDAEN